MVGAVREPSLHYVEGRSMRLPPCLVRSALAVKHYPARVDFAYPCYPFFRNECTAGILLAIV